MNKISAILALIAGMVMLTGCVVQHRVYPANYAHPRAYYTTTHTDIVSTHHRRVFPRRHHRVWV